MWSFVLKIFVIIFCVFCVELESKSLPNETKPVNSVPSEGKSNSYRCKEMPPEVLAKILGDAYNPRYMSIEFPAEEEVSKGMRRQAGSGPPSFYAEEDLFDHLREVNDTVLSRRRRANMGRPGFEVNNKGLHPWQCEKNVRWIDLGKNYFPQYIRTVECAKQDCWYGMFTCKPRSFTIKVLNRQSSCSQAEFLNKFTDKYAKSSYLDEYGEVWQWREVTVTFCCECATV